MARHVRLFGLLLAVPVFALIVAFGFEAQYTRELRAGERHRHPNASADTLAAISIRQLCADDPTAGACDQMPPVLWMERGAVAAIVLAFGLLAAISFSGRAARGNRSLLLRLFKPGLHITIATVTLLIALYTTLALAAMASGAEALGGSPPPIFAVSIVVGAVAGIWMMFRGLMSMVTPPPQLVVGERVSRDDAPTLWATVEETARRIGSLAPEHIVVGLSLNFFVTEGRVTGFTGPITGRTLYCSLPFCRILTVDEFIGVIGHELAHFKGQDTAFSRHFYPVYRGAIVSLGALESAAEGMRQIALRPAIAVLQHFLECFGVAEREVGRERELAADREGAAVTSETTMATLLVKTHAFDAAARSLEGMMFASAAQGRPITNASKAYAAAVAASATRASFDGIADRHTPHPTDSHPPLAARLASLGVTLTSVTDAALYVTPSNPAISLVDDAEVREERLTVEYFPTVTRTTIRIPEDHADDHLESVLTDSSIGRASNIGVTPNDLG